MRKLTITLIFILTICLSTTTIYAQDEEDTFTTTPGGKYLFGGISGDILVFYPSTPMTTDRFATYGSVVTNKAGKREVDTSMENKVTPAGKQIYDKIMLVQSGGFYFILATTLEYHRVTIVKYKHVTWELALDEVLAVFADLEK